MRGARVGVGAGVGPGVGGGFVLGEGRCYEGSLSPSPATASGSRGLMLGGGFFASSARSLMFTRVYLMGPAMAAAHAHAQHDLGHSTTYTQQAASLAAMNDGVERTVVVVVVCVCWAIGKGKRQSPCASAGTLGGTL